MLRNLFFLLVFWPFLAFAQQDYIPEKSVAISHDQDFYGADLTQIFDTNLQACVRACLANTSCKAFTYNQRSRSCFPKSEVSERTVFQGALSGVVVSQDPKQSQLRATELRFLPAIDLERARSQANSLYLGHDTQGKTRTTLLDAAQDLRRNGANLAAIDRLGAALSLDGSTADWLDFATLQQEVSIKDYTSRQNTRKAAKSAAINAYLRAETPQDQIRALQVLARSLEDVGPAKATVPALRLATELGGGSRVAAALERVRGLYGFRVLDTVVSSDLATPRICIVFSEPLAKGGVIYGDFIQAQTQDLAITAEGSQLCLQGFEHGTTQRLALRSGLPAADGQTLSKSIPLSFYVRDRAPSVQFTGRAYVLPKTAQAAIPVQTVNVSDLILSLHSVSNRNILRAIQDGFIKRSLSQYQAQEFGTEIGAEIWTGVAKVENQLNATNLTRLPVQDALQDQPAGVYVLKVHQQGQDLFANPPALQWFVVTDLGLSTVDGVDGLNVSVLGLGDAEPVGDTSLTLLSQSNGQLDQVVTDVSGAARFSPAVMRGTGGAAPALILAQKGDDFAYLSLSDPAFDLSDRGVAGRPAAQTIDAFLTADRGAYRAGETVFATLLLRKPDGTALSNLPATAVLERPDGVEYAREISLQDQAGGHVFQFPIALGVPRGTWTLKVYSDLEGSALAQSLFLVEDFLPDRIEADLILPEKPVKTGTTLDFQLQADFLFGAPAGNMSVEGEVRLQPARVIAGYEGYIFGSSAEEPVSAMQSLPANIKTDAQGLADIRAKIPEVAFASRPLEAVVRARVMDGAGRPVERQATLPVLGQADLIGARPLFDGVVAENDSALFSIVTLDAARQPVKRTVEWSLNRLTTRYQWYQLNGRWQWEHTVTRELVSQGVLNTQLTALTLAVDVTWGEYELVIEGTQGAYSKTSATFWAGWYGSGDTTQTPDRLDVSLDQPAYKVGETATLRVVARTDGMAEVKVLSNRLISRTLVPVQAGTTQIPLNVTEDWGAGAYVSASLIRPMDVSAGLNPSRAIGLAYASVDPAEKRFDLKLDVPAKSRPRAPLLVSLDLGAQLAGDTAFVTLAASDVGILNITGFQPPDPIGHYFGQRQLGVGLRDIYGRLIDGLNGAMGQVRSGGDAGAVMGMQSPPPSEDLVTFFSGPIKVDATGRAEVTLDVPNFNGTLRLMAIAWSDQSIGAASADVVIADPVVIGASLPRFLGPTDTSQMRLDVRNLASADEVIEIEVSATNGLSISNAKHTLTLPKGAEQTLFLPLSANDLGDHSITLNARFGANQVMQHTYRLSVVQNDPVSIRTSRFELPAGASLDLTDDIYEGFVGASGDAVLSIGSIAELDVAGLLQTLDRYPYSCTEQLTSGALPLLSLGPVAQELGLSSTTQSAQKVRDAIAQILTRQSSEGGFGLWRADSGDVWLDAYVADFLSRAREQGFDVPDRAFDALANALQNRVNYAPDFETGGEGLAYALMVLAREGRASIGDLRYYADTKSDAFATPLALAQIAAALTQYGDRTRATQLFTKVQTRLDQSAPETGLTWRSDYGTRLRDAAAVLAIARETGTTVIDQNQLVARISNDPKNRSTQEAAWILRAVQSQSGSPSMSYNAAPLAQNVLRLSNDTGAHILTNTGTKSEVLTLSTRGIPSVAPAAGGTGYAIKRQYFDLQGNQVQTAAVAIGTLLIAVLTVQPFDTMRGRLMVVDPFSAGFEADNPNLLRSGDVSALDWLNLANPEHTEFRTDRFLAAVDWQGDKPFHLAYSVRAVHEGTFHHAAPSVEDMYRPERRGIGTTTQRVITK